MIIHRDWVPAYARRPLEQFRQTGEVEGLDNKDSLEPHQARLAGWSHRTHFLQIKTTDGSRRDELPDQPGRVKTGQREFLYEGHALNGAELIQRAPWGVFYTRMHGSQIEHLHLSEHGYQAVERIDLEHPERSLRLSKPSERSNDPGIWQPSRRAFSPTCASLAKALAQADGDLKRKKPEARIPSGLPYYHDTTVAEAPYKTDVEQARTILEESIPGYSGKSLAAQIENLPDAGEAELQQIDTEAFLHFADLYSRWLYRQYWEFPDSLSPSERLVIEQGIKASGFPAAKRFLSGWLRRLNGI